MVLSHLNHVLGIWPSSRMADARRAAVSWWMQGRTEAARCDSCNCELYWGEGYLIPGGCVLPERRAGTQAGAKPPAYWLVCEICYRDRRGVIKNRPS
jgi:hypothetical protein